MPTTSSSVSDRFPGNQLFAHGIEQAHRVIEQRLMASAASRVNDAPGILDRIRGLARQHPIAAAGALLLAVGLASRFFGSR